MAAYAHPDVLVETSWLASHLNDPKVRIAEVDYDPSANYEMGHIPGSFLFDWRKDINDPVARDILSQDAMTALFARAGIDNDTTVVLYGDFNNWFAAFAYWVFTYYGAKNLKLMNGGRKKWIAEDLPLTKEVPAPAHGHFQAHAPNPQLRSYLDDVRKVLPEVKAGQFSLVDVRGPKEFSGEITAPPEYPTEHAQRGGHIPGAKNVPWAQAVREDGTFKSREELEELYKSKGVSPGHPVITYCRIGERSSHTWFVLKYLLGFPNVSNYDGSWTEWGNLVGAPVEKGAAPARPGPFTPVAAGVSSSLP
jgi:thiosulfate/3-mercaptopyruvate sulfurtransferase